MRVRQYHALLDKTMESWEVKILTKAISEYLYLELGPGLQVFLTRSLLKYIIFIFKFFQDPLEKYLVKYI